MTRGKIVFRGIVRNYKYRPPVGIHLMENRVRTKVHRHAYLQRIHLNTVAIINRVAEQTIYE